jgi:seryl-tRNA synthetase
MVDVRDVVADPDAVRSLCAARGIDVDIDRIIELDGLRRRLIRTVDELRHRSKTLSRKRSGDVGDGETAKRIRIEERELSSRLREVTTELDELRDWLPNVLDSRVPMGGEDATEVVRVVGPLPAFAFEPQPAHVIGQRLGIIEIEGAVRSAQPRFYAFVDQAVLLRQALVRMFTEHVRDQGFRLLSPPTLAKPETLRASGYLPFQGRDNFALRDEPLSLIGTSEQAILGMHMGTTFVRLPVAYLGDSMCYRTEAGSYGRDTAGILRAHQFYKLEQFVFCHPSDSEHWFQRCLANEEWLLVELGIPYQVVCTAAGDLGAPAMIKFDTEAWFPAQGRYRELTSNSNLGDFQTRRGGISFTFDDDKGAPHTISATAFTDRLILALLETYQQEDGSVLLPAALAPWLGELHLKR